MKRPQSIEKKNIFDNSADLSAGSKWLLLLERRVAGFMLITTGSFILHVHLSKQSKRESFTSPIVLHTFNFQDEVLILQEHLTNFKTEEIGWDGFNLFLFVY